MGELKYSNDSLLPNLVAVVHICCRSIGDVLGVGGVVGVVILLLVLLSVFL